MALTFDDGPDDRHTRAVMSALAAHGARATFFVVGHRAERLPHMVRDLRDAGHEIGNHTYRHRHAWLCGAAATRADVIGGAAVLEAILGDRPAWFRPPWGKTNRWSAAAVDEAGERMALWTLDGGDWLPWASEAMLVRRVGGARPGDVVDLHDDRAVLAAALPRILAALAARGLRCVPLSEVLDQP